LNASDSRFPAQENSTSGMETKVSTAAATNQASRQPSVAARVIAAKGVTASPAGKPRTANDII
jgi:hypothetical protein